MSIILRQIKEADLTMIMKWRMLPEITKQMFTEPKLTMADQKEWYKKIRQDNTSKYWIIQVDQIDIGVIYLADIDIKNKRCCWAYYIADSSFRGRGLGRALECNTYQYVFENLKLNKLWCEVFSANEKVIAIHQRFGSENEGVLKQHIYKNKQFFDVVRMAITKDRWHKIKSQMEYEKISIEE